MSRLETLQPDATRRRRLTAAISLLGVLLSIAAFHVAVLGRFEYFEDAVRIEGWGAVFFSVGAAVSALIVVPIAVFHVRDMAQIPAKPITWLFMGFAFGVATPILTGGLTRISGVFAGLAEGVYGVGSLPSLLLDAVIIFPYDMFIQGAPNVYAGLLSGGFFAIIGFLMDRLNAMKSESVSMWGPWIVAVGLGIPIMVFALTGPTEFLRDLVR
ncbi:MAG: hypothetical protein F4Y63_10650 [Chloroflexi bacterium]|nr:hypothetical protein [Chloroflexota bacterium]MYF79550.1 hypothetical protein [Chloroflexota bacterium]MYK61286.1 hypothetical protein [Chloroflexota bacterium]